MKQDWSKTSAYQGRGWKPRTHSLREELGRHWNGFGVNSEWSKLEAVALYRPRLELTKITSPRRVQHLRPISRPQLEREYKTLVAIYRSLDIQVVELDPSLLPLNLREAPPNLMFVRDLFVATPEGCVIGRMASRVRAGEEKFAAVTLAAQGIPLRATIAGRGLFEGADALWLDPHTVLVGVGNRTNKPAFSQLKEIFASQGVQVLATLMPAGVQHLLGILQIPAPRLAVVRTDKAPKPLIQLLRRRGFVIVPVPECAEVTQLQGMNFVTVDNGKIVMAKGCPDLRGWLESAGLKVVAEAPISQLCNAAGGLACATGIVGRRMLK
ncbi:MAG: hypothetical protein KF799_02710 [Bdellovibrionales bacterium]|nr:hypothetical protein [Bdellovibrionales bacterium]